MSTTFIWIDSAREGSTKQTTRPNAVIFRPFESQCHVQQKVVSCEQYHQIEWKVDRWNQNWILHSMQLPSIYNSQQYSSKQSSPSAHHKKEWNIGVIYYCLIVVDCRLLLFGAIAIFRLAPPALATIHFAFIVRDPLLLIRPRLLR